MTNLFFNGHSYTRIGINEIVNCNYYNKHMQHICAQCYTGIFDRELIETMSNSKHIILIVTITGARDR
jgi:hypothetical protein